MPDAQPARADGAASRASHLTATTSGWGHISSTGPTSSRAVSGSVWPSLAPITQPELVPPTSRQPTSTQDPEQIIALMQTLNQQMGVTFCFPPTIRA